jgi:hypothetical protein
MISYPPEIVSPMPCAVTEESHAGEVLTSGFEADWGMRLARFLLFASLTAIFLLTIAGIWITWHNDSQLSCPSGVWLALAADLKSGVFYRPLFGPLGYGGTRYFPLLFVMEAGLTLAGLSARVAGHIIELLSMITLLGGVYVLLRNLKVAVWLAVASSVAILATGPAQFALVGIRGDVLPAALNVLGLALCAREWPRFRHIVVAAILFTLAFSAKETCVFGVAAAVFAFLVSDRRKLAIQLFVGTAAGYGLVLAAMFLLSGGRAFDVLRAGGMAGAGIRDLALGPVHLLMALTHFEPIANAGLATLGAAALVAWGRDREASIAPAFLVGSAAATTLILGTPGTGYNHLIDFDVAAVVTFTVWASRQGKQYLTFNTAALAIITILAVPPLVHMLRYDDKVPIREEINKAVRMAGNSGKPLLAENPLVALEAHQTPYVADLVVFAALNKRDPAFAEPLWRNLAQKSFGAVVLVFDPETNAGKDWYMHSAFGPGFVEHLQQNYYPAWKGEATYVYLPRGQ